MDAYTAYKQELNIPAQNRSWVLRGEGMDRFFFEQEDIPVPGKNEVLMRVDAVSICFSDVKLIKAGSNHPRVLVPLEDRPTVPGHEVSLTAVRAGENVKDMFVPGSRYIIQADIFKNGKIDTFGYTQRGGMALCVLVKETAVKGDAGCYLLPVRETTGYSEAALVEPWACVESSYHITQSSSLSASSKIFLHPALDMLEKGLADKGCTGISRKPRSEADRVFIPSDISGEEYAEIEEQACDGAVIGIVDAGKGASLPVDAGAIHYRNLRIVSGSMDTIMPRVETGNRQGLKPGGKALFVGAGGPMGQMHVQRAVELENGPACIAVTDVNGERLGFITERFSGTAHECSVNFSVFDASGPTDTLRDNLLEYSEGGFDDIVMLAPVPALVAESQHLTREGTLINIFAGIPVGSPFLYDTALASGNNISFTGHSGSSLEDLAQALSMVEHGKIRSDRIVRAIGGLEVLKNGVKAVMEGVYAGKVVIYPHLGSLPLISLDDLSEEYPDVSTKLDNGHWNRGAEQALFNMLLRTGR